MRTNSSTGPIPVWGDFGLKGNVHIGGLKKRACRSLRTRPILHGYSRQAACKTSSSLSVALSSSIFSTAASSRARRSRAAS